MARTEFEIVIPPEVTAGETFTIEVRMECHGETAVEGITLGLFGIVETRWDETVQKQHLVDRVRYGEARFTDATRLEGRQRWSASFTIPSHAPPTYLSTVGLGEVKYVLELHAGIPWWFDVEETRELVVRSPDRPRPPPRSAMSSTLAHAVSVELSVGATELAPGDRLTGSCAVVRDAEQGGGSIEIALVGRESGRFGGEASRVILHRLSRAEDGEANAFSAYVPRTTKVGFATRDLSLSYVLQAVVETTGKAVTVEIPLVIDHFEGSAKRAEVPAIGRERWSTSWRAIGEANDLQLEDGALRGEIDGCALSIAPERLALCATLRGWPSFGLGLSIGEKRLFERSLPIDHRLATRTLVQSTVPQTGLAFFRPSLLDALDAFERIELDDEHAVVRTGTDPHDEEKLADFVARVLVLAKELALSAAWPERGPYR